MTSELDATDSEGREERVPSSGAELESSTPKPAEQEMEKEEEAENDGSESDEELKPMQRTKRQCTLDQEARSLAKRPKRSLTFEEGCALKLGETCKKIVGDGHRLSKSEASCLCCFTTTFRGRDYEAAFIEWKQKAKDGQMLIRSMNSAKRFINSQFLPYYKKCYRCSKYTQVFSTATLTARDFAGFECSGDCDNTKEPESIVNVRRDVNWSMNEFGHPPLLQNNVSFDLLSAHYVTKTAGLDATCQEKAELIDDGGVPFRDTQKIMNMFYVPETDVIANIVHPEFMETDEKFAFPKYADDPHSIYYLQVRNTIVAMWLKHPFVELTAQMVESQIICRGHARIFFLEHLVKPILEFLTIKGVVNYGAFDFRINPVKTNVKVAIIGAGISGMSTARHLKHLGINAVLFEAKDRHGGRMNDDRSMGVAVGKGAQIIVGNINNPITLLCEQIGIKYRNSNIFCPLIDETGRCFTTEMKNLDDQVDLHYNNVLDAIRNKYAGDANFPDVTLEELFSKMSSGLLEASGLNTELNVPEFEKLLDFHLGNLEFSCGTKVENLSAKEYDHNEKFGNFAGEHAVITDGAQRIVDFLAQGLDIRLDSAVKTIDWRDRKVRIHFEDGRRAQDFDKVVVTTSLAVLKKNPKMFLPMLPSSKQKAINDLGAGLIEKIAVKFDRRFWKSVDADGVQTEYFGRVPDSKKDRSLFNIFYDFSGIGSDGEETYVLMSYVTGEHVNMVNELTDEQVAEQFVASLRKMFPNETINPLAHTVSHWGADPHIGMSYTFVPVGSAGDATYNKLKETVDDKIYFAGEHTIAAEPQTMAGAFMSGLREAGKIVLSLKCSVPELTDT